jgi:hypothetical protein
MWNDCCVLVFLSLDYIIHDVFLDISWGRAVVASSTRHHRPYKVKDAYSLKKPKTPRVDARAEEGR